MNEVVPTIEAIDDGSMCTVPIEETRKRLHARIDELAGKTPSRS